VNPIPLLSLYPLECAAIVGTAALATVRWLPERRRRPVATGAAVVSVGSGVALLIAGVRWQMLPVLVAMVLLLAALATTILARPARRVPTWLAMSGTVFVACLLAAGSLTAWALPVPNLPDPTGRYPVGTTVLQWTDTERSETATADPDDRRVVVAQFWYPAASAAGEHAPYFGRTHAEAEVVADAQAEYVGVPGFVLDGLTRAVTASVVDAKPATGRFPVVLFSPGLGGVRGQNTVWAQELASRGHVVVALDHPYDSAAVVLEDGTVIRTQVTGDVAGWVAVRAQDLSFVRTQLDRTRFAGLLDLDRVAVTGHSAGGAAALMAARQDHRFAAVIDLDGYPYDPAPAPFPQPALVLNHPLLPGESPDYLAEVDDVLGLSQAASYRVEVPGTMHLTFTDAPLWLPPMPSAIGLLGRAEGPALTADVTAEFLDHALNGRPLDLSRYGSVRYAQPGIG
jgi:predicted dienelactone hydrolase